MVEPNWIAINRLQLTLPHLAAEFEQYRIVQISDIHVDKWTNEERLNRIFRLVNSQQLDLIAITGDFVTAEQQMFLPKLAATIGQLAPSDQTVAVLGNHDRGADSQLALLTSIILFTDCSAVLLPLRFNARPEITVFTQK